MVHTVEEYEKYALSRMVPIPDLTNYEQETNHRMALVWATLAQAAATLKAAEQNAAATDNLVQTILRH